MKITQTNNQLEIKNSGIGTLIGGIGFIVAGVLGTVLMLNGSATNESGEETSSWFALIGVAFAAVGCLIAWFAKSSKIVLRRGGDTTVRAKRILNGKTNEQSFPTANIAAVQLHTYIENSSNDSANSSRKSTLSLLLKNNDLVELGTGRNNGFNFKGINLSSMIRKAPLSKEANQIATFLGVPLQNSDASSITGAIKSIKEAFDANQTNQKPPSNQPPADQ